MHINWATVHIILELTENGRLGLFGMEGPSRCYYMFIDSSVIVYVLSGFLRE
jgi:hypothetical protein